MATWDFISKRRRIRLANFIEGANTLEEALAIFHRKKVSPPTDGTLEALFESAVAEEQLEELEEQPVVELVQDETVESEDVPELTAKKQTGFSNSKKGNSKKKKKYASKKTSTTNESESENDV